jgi:N-methylhydantoinase A
MEEAAAGMIDVVDAHMERALRAVSVEEGVDPRGSVLVAFGGAGGLHASRLARRLGMAVTLIPPLSGVFSALGLLLARPSSDAIRTVMLDEGSPWLSDATRSIMLEAVGSFTQDHGDPGDEVAVLGEVRYVGQSHELSVPLGDDWAALRQAFEAEHQARFGFTRDGQPIELVNVKAEMTGPPPLTWGDLPPHGVGSGRPSPGALPAMVGSKFVEVPVWQRRDLPSGFAAPGPGLVVEKDSAVWLEPGDRLSVHVDGTLELAHE